MSLANTVRWIDSHIDNMLEQGKVIRLIVQSVICGALCFLLLGMVAKKVVPLALDKLEQRYVVAPISTACEPCNKVVSGM